LSESLLEFLQRTQAECGGAIPAERAMREALYHPTHGYYARNIRTVGRRGDFATSASLGEALGSGIARWLWQNRILHHGEHGAAEPASSPFSMSSMRSVVPHTWLVIEAGAGSGELARTVLRRLGPWRRLGLHYHIVETSPVLRAEQQRALPQFRVHWHDSMEAALAACDGRALVFSNELLDAFPCRVFEQRDGHWRELGIRVEGGHVAECLLACDPPASSALQINAAEGQRVEVNVAAAEWLASWAGTAREVRMLTIDYGDETPALYRRRPRGTLRAYFHHQRFEGVEVWHRFGRQDITADVNFTDLHAWTERLGWRTLALETQAEFLAAHGAVHAGLHDATLADHTGAGGAFKVLICEKRAPQSGAPPALPSGLHLT
jgi:SAM-dependent MidA family methyltransferase